MMMGRVKESYSDAQTYSWGYQKITILCLGKDSFGVDVDNVAIKMPPIRTIIVSRLSKAGYSEFRKADLFDLGYKDALKNTLLMWSAKNGFVICSQSGGQPRLLAALE